MIFNFPITYKSEDSKRVINFTCKCGSHSVKHISDFSHSFFEGSFICCNCGMSVINNQELNYYHPFFIISDISDPVQLSLF